MRNILQCVTKCVFLVLISMPASAKEPLVIASGIGRDAPQQPQAVVDEAGTVHLVYGAGDTVFYCQSREAGTSEAGTVWSKPVQAFQVPNQALGMRRGPRIAISGKSIVVTAIGGLKGKGRDGDVQAWRSSDDGATWEGPVHVNDTTDSAREGLHAMAAGDDGTVWCAWLDLRDKKTEVYISRSTDHGATWQLNICVYRSPDGSVCECCHPSVIVSGKAVHILFRNSLSGNRDMYVTTSTDGGGSFSKAVKLGLGNWELDACPMDGGMLTTGLKGEVLTVWRRDGNVYAAKADGTPEQLLGTGQQPWVTSSASGPVIVWTTGRDGDLLLRSPGEDQPKTLARGARDAVICSGRNGNGPIVCCWESKRDGKSVVMAQILDAK